MIAKVTDPNTLNLEPTGKKKTYPMAKSSNMRLAREVSMNLSITLLKVGTKTTEKTWRRDMVWM